MVFLFSDILIYARPNLLEKRESCDRWSLQKPFLYTYMLLQTITSTEHMNFAVCYRCLIQLFAFYVVTIACPRLKYFCRLEPNFYCCSMHDLIEYWTQISNGDTALTFFSSKKDDILQWNETIKDAIMYVSKKYGIVHTVTTVILHVTLQEVKGCIWITDDFTTSF